MELILRCGYCMLTTHSLLVTNNHRKQTEISESLEREFEMTVLDEPKKFLGLERVKDIIFLYQRKFIESILNKFNEESCKYTYGYTRLLRESHLRKLKTNRWQSQSILFR